MDLSNKEVSGHKVLSDQEKIKLMHSEVPVKSSQKLLSEGMTEIVRGMVGVSSGLANIFKCVHPVVGCPVGESQNKLILNPRPLLLIISVLKSVC